MSTDAYVTRDVISWALDRASLPRETVAKRINVKPERLDAWLRGDERPTFKQALNLAHTLHVPFGYLFLSAPPTERLNLPDLRTIGDEPPPEPSPELLDVVDDVLRKQQWFRAYREEEGAEPLPFVGRYSASDPIEEVATNIRATIRITPQLRRNADDWEEFVRLLIQQIESAGILVLRNGVVGNNTTRKLKVQEFRGFVVSDDIAPFIFVNGSDWRSAQVFTLAHELVHIWIGASGVSNPDYRGRSEDVGNTIERYCNRVAAEVLLPNNEFTRSWNRRDTVEQNVRKLSREYKASQIVTLIQARDLSLITYDEYREQYDRLSVRQQRPQDDGGSGGNFYNTLFARNSLTLTTALMAAVAEGRVLRRDAADLLNVKLKTLDGVASRTIGTTIGG